MTNLLASRRLRWVTLGFASVASIALFLLATATANTSLFAGHYNTLVLINGGIVALLMLVVGGQLLQLWRNLRAGVFGSRLALRLVLAVRARRVPAGRARVRGIGAIPRAQHRKLVRRPRRSRARRRLEPRPKLARLPAEGDEQSREGDRQRGRRRGGRARTCAGARGRAGGRLRGGAVCAFGQRTRRRGPRRQHDARASVG